MEVAEEEVAEVVVGRGWGWRVHRRQNGRHPQARAQAAARLGRSRLERDLAMLVEGVVHQLAPPAIVQEGAHHHARVGHHLRHAQSQRPGQRRQLDLLCEACQDRQHVIVTRTAAHGRRCRRCHRRCGRRSRLLGRRSLLSWNELQRKARPRPSNEMACIHVGLCPWMRRNGPMRQRSCPRRARMVRRQARCLQALNTPGGPVEQRLWPALDHTGGWRSRTARTWGRAHA